MNKTVPAHLPHLPNMLLLFFSLTITTVYAAQTTIEEPFTKPTYYSVCFATGLPKVYPADIINRLAMIKEINRLGLKKSRVVDLSHTPDLTQEKFDDLAALIDKPDAIPKDDQAFLDVLSTTDTLLEENDTVRTKLLKQLMNKIRIKQCDSKDSVKQFCTLFTNHQAALFINEVRKKAKNSDFTLPGHASSYFDSIEPYTVRVGPQIHRDFLFPIPDPVSGKPRLDHLFISIQHLINTEFMPSVKDTGYNSDTDDEDEENIIKKTLSLSHAHLTSLIGLPYLPALSILNLNVNCIRTVPKDAFKNTPNLTDLNLADNLITDIHPEAFAGLTQLEKLNISNNRLTTIASLTRTNLPQLKLLTFHNNPLETIDVLPLPPSCIFSIWEGLKVFYGDIEETAHHYKNTRN